MMNFNAFKIQNLVGDENKYPVVLFSNHFSYH